MRKEQPVTGEFYHIITRGVEQRKVFLVEEDYLRFVNSLYVFNSSNPTSWHHRFFWKKKTPQFLTKEHYNFQDPLVEMHAFALMPNHTHLLVRQLVENGVRIFMNKLGGYSYYFNKKYKRVGPLFQGRYKMKRIETDRQLRNTFVYIHTNPIAMHEPDWKEWKVKNAQNAIQFLEEQYRWSSYWDYLERTNFPLLIIKDFFLKVFGTVNAIREETNSWIRYKNVIFKSEERVTEAVFE